jgi:hypothetical protein
MKGIRETLIMTGDKNRCKGRPRGVKGSGNHSQDMTMGTTSSGSHLQDLDTGLE